MQQQLKQDSKAVYRLKQLVGHECKVWLRSSPETIISGVLDSYDIESVPSILCIDSGNNGRRIINMQDMSFIEEIP